MNFGFKGKSQERTGCKMSTLTPFPLMISGKRFQLLKKPFIFVGHQILCKKGMDINPCHIQRETFTTLAHREAAKIFQNHAGHPGLNLFATGSPG